MYIWQLMLPIVISIPIRFPIVRVVAGLITIVIRKLYCCRIWILRCIKTTFSLTSPIIIRLRHENPFPQWIMLGCRVGWMCNKEGYHKYFSLNFHLLNVKSANISQRMIINNNTLHIFLGENSSKFLWCDCQMSHKHYNKRLHFLPWFISC